MADFYCILIDINLGLLVFAIVIYIFNKYLKSTFDVKNHKPENPIIKLKADYDRVCDDLAKLEKDHLNAKDDLEDSYHRIKKLEHEKATLLKKVSDLESMEHAWEFRVANTRPISNRIQQFKSFVGTRKEVINAKTESEARFKLCEKFPPKEGFVIKSTRQLR